MCIGSMVASTSLHHLFTNLEGIYVNDIQETEISVLKVIIKQNLRLLMATLPLSLRSIHQAPINKQGDRSIDQSSINRSINRSINQ